MKPINKIIFTFAIVFAIFILGIGYAAISTNLTLDSNIYGETQEEVFITDFYAYLMKHIIYFIYFVKYFTNLEKNLEIFGKIY